MSERPPTPPIISSELLMRGTSIDTSVPHYPPLPTINSTNENLYQINLLTVREENERSLTWPAVLRLLNNDSEAEGVVVIDDNRQYLISEINFSASEPSPRIQTLTEEKYDTCIEKNICEGICSICTDDIKEDGVKIKKCGHVFHNKCIKKYLTEHSSKCPNCRCELCV